MPKGNEQFAEHVQRRTAVPPAVLYKYVTVEAARCILSTGRLRFQSPLRYNDPFDSQWDTLWPLSTPAAQEYERGLIENAIREPSSWPTNADPEMGRVMGLERNRIAALPEDQRDEGITRFVQDAMRRQSTPEPLLRHQLDTRRRLRVFCLSQTDRSILMWSHYADQHRGVVLGFDSAAMENGWERPIEPVSYADGPPALFDPQQWIRATVYGVPDHPVLDAQAVKWVLTKHKDWGYEKEWRFVWTDPPGSLGDHQDMSFPRRALVELVMGCRADPVRAQELASLALAIRPDVNTFQMMKSRTSFELQKTKTTFSELHVQN